MSELRVRVYDSEKRIVDFFNYANKSNLEIWLDCTLRYFVASKDYEKHGDKGGYFINTAHRMTADSLVRISNSLYDRGVQEKLDNLENDILGAIAEGEIEE